MKITTLSAQQTEALGIRLSKKIKKGNIVGVYGELGAGKTTLIRGIIKAIEGVNLVPSPTFNIIIEYEQIIHMDLYRLGEEDFYSLGLDNLEEKIVLVEWPERFHYFLIPDIKIRIYVENEVKRVIEIDGIPWN